MRFFIASVLFANIASAFQFVGRVNPATKELTWSGTGVSFAFRGTTATIAFSRVTGTNSVELVIDDGTPTVIANVVGTSISTPILSQGNHIVVLRKRSEASYGSLFVSGVTTDGTENAQAPPKRRIEIIGDSITVGYGLDGVNPCTNSASVEDAPKTYGALAAKALNAAYSIVAWSGKGLIRNYPTGSTDTSPIMPQLYTRYGANDADNSFTFPADSAPDAVVINLGQNDFGYLNARPQLNVTEYTAAMVSFVKSIRTHYPKAHFFLVGSPMLSDSYPTTQDAQKTTQTKALQSAVTQLNSSNAHFVQWPSQGSAVGCDYHPNADTHAAEGTVLAAAIKSALGW